MTDWQLTATTIFCDDMKDEVTIIVYKDGKIKCTGYDTFSKQNPKASNKNNQECRGPVCQRMEEYKNRLLSEEK